MTMEQDLLMEQQWVRDPLTEQKQIRDPFKEQRIRDPVTEQRIRDPETEHPQDEQRPSQYEVIGSTEIWGAGLYFKTIITKKHIVFILNTLLYMYTITTLA